MKIIKSLFILFFINIAGNVISHFTGRVLPGSVIAILLLFLLLSFRIIKPEKIETTAYFLVSSLPLFLIPSAVGIMECTSLDIREIVTIILIVVFTTILTMAVTAYVTELLINLAGENRDE